MFCFYTFFDFFPYIPSFLYHLLLIFTIVFLLFENFMFNIFWSYLPLSFPLNSLQVHLPPPPNFMSFNFLITYQVQLVLLLDSWVWDHPLGVLSVLSLQEPHLKRKHSFSSRGHRSWKVVQSGWGLMSPSLCLPLPPSISPSLPLVLPPSRLECWLACSCAVMVAVSSWVWWSCLVRKTRFHFHFDIWLL